MKEPNELTDEQVIASLDVWQVYALTLLGEAQDQGREGMRAVADAIDNRHKAKPHLSHRDVCLARAQFSCWRPAEGAGNYEFLIATARRVRLRGNKVGPIVAACFAVAGERLANPALPDTVMGATHYMTEKLWRTRPPKWAIGQRPVCQIRDHVFFAGIAW